MPTVAFEIPGFRYSLEANADLSAGQFRALAGAALGRVAFAGAGAVSVGILQNKPAAQGEAAQIVQTGISKGLSGGAIAVWEDVTPDASGDLVVAAVGDVVLGQAVTPSGGAGEIISVLLGAGARIHEV